MKSIGINPESIAELIDRVHQFQAQDAVEASSEGDAEGANPALEELRIALDDLEPDQQVDLVALMWLGRGDYSADEWESAREDAGERWTPNAADYLIETPLLADYWTEGLQMLQEDDDR